MISIKNVRRTVAARKVAEASRCGRSRKLRGKRWLCRRVDEGAYKIEHKSIHDIDSKTHDVVRFSKLGAGISRKVRSRRSAISKPMCHAKRCNCKERAAHPHPRVFHEQKIRRGSEEVRGISVEATMRKMPKIVRSGPQKGFFASKDFKRMKTTFCWTLQRSHE